jgi:exopolyphosphatase / guanosine-5'-triphosphate,3'-diphosphate pyrophosphatase
VISSDNSFRTEEENSVKARLGEGLDEKGSLRSRSIDRVLEILKLFREIIDIKSIKHVLPIATSAVREAQNKQDFLSMAYEQTGFQFRVLSEVEEALYSYLGAVRATCYPDILFFDMGGGSLEIVRSKDYRIKKIMSLPLGALRLSEKFGRKDNRLPKNGINKLQKAILKTLPDPRDLEYGNNTKLVGVGGSIRAIARYDQKIRKYPINILHNYVMDYRSVQLVKKKLSKMDLKEIADIDAIGSNRATSITAASILLNTMMQKFKIESMVVSIHGLREGYLTGYLNNFSNKRSVRLDAKWLYDHLKDQIEDKCDHYQLPKSSSKFIQMLISFGLMRKGDYEIFVNAKQELLGRLAEFWQPDIIFNLIMNDVFPRLSHEDKLILALSIIFRRKPKAAEKMCGRYSIMLQGWKRKSIQKIAACIDLTEILERFASHVDLFKDDTGRLTLKIVSKTNIFPEYLLNDKIKLFESAAHVELIYTISRPRK